MVERSKREVTPPDDDACVGCEYAGGIVLHYCTHRQSEFFGCLVDFEGWCPQFVPRREQ
jgi:hypothetical protein